MAVFEGSKEVAQLLARATFTDGGAFLKGFWDCGGECSVDAECELVGAICEGV